MYRNVSMLFWYECKYLFGYFNIVGEIKSALKDAEKAVVLDSKNPVGSILMLLNLHDKQFYAMFDWCLIHLTCIVYIYI